MQPRFDQAELPIQGVEPHEFEPKLPPMRSYDEMLSRHYTDGLRPFMPNRAGVVFNPIGPWRRET
jgi:hypothetical protein